MDEQKNLPLPEKGIPQPHDMLLRSPTFFEKYPFLKWLLPLIITFLLLLSASVYVLQSQKPKPIMQQPTPTTILPSPTPADPTANWKTYTTNESLDIDDTMLKKFPTFKPTRLSFTYPSWLQVSKADQTTARANYAKSIVNMGFELKNEEYRTSHSGPSDYSVGLLFTYATVPNGLKAFDTSFWEDVVSNNIIKTEEKMINGVKATFTYESSSSSSPGSLAPVGVIFHLSSTEQVKVLVSFYSFDEDCITERCKQIANEINQILSTFKFLDEDHAIDTSNWKIYTLGNYFSFKFPSEWKEYTTIPKEHKNGVFRNCYEGVFFQHPNNKPTLIYVHINDGDGRGLCYSGNLSEKYRSRKLTYPLEPKIAYSSSVEVIRWKDINSNWNGVLFEKVILSPGISFIMIHNSDQASEVIFDQILSTFKFIENASHIYENDKYNFTVTLPQNWYVVEELSDLDRILFSGQQVEDDRGSPPIVGLYIVKSSELKQGWEEDYRPYAEITTIKRDGLTYIFTATSYINGIQASETRDSRAKEALSKIISTLTFTK